ncbi:hypothetical protein [Methylophilus luteus]|uniref:DUF4145 domain-containing protein n=1 Tax=Methylophilus luteus TaxID=640108 RepID=A0ABW3F9I2_9PROT
MSLSPEESDMQPHTQKEYEQYLRAIKGPPVMVILRTHLLTEYYLERALRAGLRRGDKLVDSATLSYSQKLAVVEAIDKFPDHVISSLRNLNKIRNRCAHEFERQVSVSDIDLIGGPYGKEYTAFKKRFPKSVRALLNHVVGTITAAMSGCVEALEEQ